MPPSLLDAFLPSDSNSSDDDLESQREQYKYRRPEDNLLAPIAVSAKTPKSEEHTAAWIVPFLPGFLETQARGLVNEVTERLQQLAFNVDKLEAYKMLFGDDLPPFAEEAEHDEAFAYRRIAGGNPIVIAQVTDLEELRREKIPFDVERLEKWLADNAPARFSGNLDLAQAARDGHLYVADYELILRALPSGESRDSRWRGKYASSPIAVFLEAPGFYGSVDLVPLAIQIDQPQPDGAYNPVYYPDEEWAWEIAKLYVESSDVTYHVGCGHIFRCHLQMEAFSLATPRQLPKWHQIYQLLRPHTQFTLTTNASAYQYFTDRKLTYYEFYSGNLQDTRGVAIESHKETTFRQLKLDTELQSRGVLEGPKVYPYRDDALRWWKPIERWMDSFVDHYYKTDDDVRDDHYVQAWIEELMDPNRGSLRGLVEGGCLDTKDKLKELLTQTLFIAGPGHASQHYGGVYYFRYAPATSSSTNLPPPESKDEATYARYLRTLPTIKTARDQWVINTYTMYRFGKFGHYDGYEIGKVEGLRDAMHRLHRDLEELEEEMAPIVRARPYRYDFLLPSRVPNSINI